MHYHKHICILLSDDLYMLNWIKNSQETFSINGFKVNLSNVSRNGFEHIKTFDAT